MKKEPPFTIGLIGWGQMARSLVKIFQNTPIRWKVHSSRERLDLPPQVTHIPWEELAKVDVLIPCVPISTLAQVLEKINQTLPAGCLMSVCSVMEKPSEWLGEKLSPEWQIVSSHPLFGPDTLEQWRGQTKLQWVVHPTRVPAQKFARLRNILSQAPVDLIEMTPAQHDREMAHSQAVAMVLGQLGVELVRPTQLSTHSFRQLENLMTTVSSKSPQLIKDLMSYNRHVPKMLAELNWGVCNQIEIVK
jgi:prephenate dehydrogenase